MNSNDVDSIVGTTDEAISFRIKVIVEHLKFVNHTQLVEQDTRNTFKLIFDFKEVKLSSILSNQDI